ncbi:MAG TPA: GIDE domain-containing protein [Gammaproteobacteria bacterium]|nr:GIDE domain-containing protein [Gammaproteobacteria bacterium]
MPLFWNSHWITDSPTADFWYTAVLICAIAVVAFFAAFYFWKRLRLVEDTPKSLIRSAAQGYVELQGRCKLMPGEPIMSPLTSTRCVWWSYRVDKRNRSSRGAKWESLEHAVSDESFFIEDYSGHCAVDPEHAQVYPSVRQVWYGDLERPAGGFSRSRFGSDPDYRYTELRVHEHDPLYALGYFHTQGPVSAGTINEEVRQLLAQWKQDQAALIRRFDTNHDGQVGQQEWDAAREEARREVLASEREAMARPPISILSRAPDGRPFILSTRPQKKLESRFRLYAAGCLLLFFVAGASATHMITLRLGSTASHVSGNYP